MNDNMMYQYDRNANVYCNAKRAYNQGVDARSVFPSFYHGNGKMGWYHGKLGTWCCWTIAWVENGKCNYLHPDMKRVGYSKEDFDNDRG